MDWQALKVSLALFGSMLVLGAIVENWALLWQWVTYPNVVDSTAQGASIVGFLFINILVSVTWGADCE